MNTQGLNQTLKGHMKIKATWSATQAGLWFVLTEDGDLWEAWAWEEQDMPPKVLPEPGWRFRKP